jgi:hypothetical protein
MAAKRLKRLREAVQALSSLLDELDDSVERSAEEVDRSAAEDPPEAVAELHAKVDALTERLETVLRTRPAGTDVGDGAGAPQPTRPEDHVRAMLFGNK